MDGSIISSPKVWEASGHVENFTDLMLACVKCEHKERADVLIEQKLKIPVESLKPGEMAELIKKTRNKMHQMRQRREGTSALQPDV